MRHEFTVEGGVAGHIPGAYGPDELDGRAEWVPLRHSASLLERIESRLGSENDVEKVVLAVLSPLRRPLEGPPLDALLNLLPRDLARELAEAEANVCAPVPPAAGAADYLLEVSRLVLHPPWRAAGYVLAVFAAARGLLSADDDETIEARLPPEIGAVWRTAR